MLEGYTPVPIEHFGGLICNWPPEMLDVSLLVEATNVRFTSSEVSSREGLTLAFKTPNRAAIMGLVDYVQLDGTEQPLVFDATGKLYVENPSGSGDLALASPSSTYTPPVGAWMNGAATYNRCYLAFGNGQQGLAAPASFDGTNLDPVTIAGPATASTGADATTAGNVASGLRYGIVLYMTREGSLTAPAPFFFWTAAGGKECVVSNLPIGPAQVASRVVAFTVAGGSSAGPYYYIGESQTVNGVNETATVINDNVTTSATFNFDDAFLTSSIDASNAYRCILLPDECGVFYSETTDRVMWWGDPAQPSVVQCSEPADAGTYYGDTGFFEVAPDNGQRVMAVFEYRDMLYCAKEYSIHLITPNNGEAATWSIQQIVPGIGACSARAVDVGSGFALIVHRTGVYTFDGSAPTLVSGELTGPSADRPGIWERINWAYDYLIWVMIDHEAKCARIGVPLDGATTCSHILKVSYIDGWDESLRFSPFTARYHYFPGRRWSLDTIAATNAVRVRRTLALGGIPADRRLGQSQMLLGSAYANGAVSYVDPGAMADNGQPFAWAIETGAVSAADVLKQQRQGIEMVGIVQMRARGMGSVQVASVVNRGTPKEFLTMTLEDSPAGDYSGLVLAQAEAVGLRFSGGDGEAPAKMSLASVYAFAQPTWALRPGR